MMYCGRRRNDNAILGEVANTWGVNWQHFGLLAGLHSYLYLLDVFWPIMGYGMDDAISQAVLPGQLEFDRRHWYSIGMHGRGIYQMESDTNSSTGNT